MVPFQTVLEKRGLPEHNNKHRTPGFTLEKTHTCFWGVWVMRADGGFETHEGFQVPRAMNEQY